MQCLDSTAEICPLCKHDIQGVPKKERHFKYICKVANK